jgi:hypothetical protein
MAAQEAVELQRLLRAIGLAIKEAAASIEEEIDSPPRLELRGASVTLRFAIEETRDGEPIFVRVDAERLKSLPEHAVSQLSFEVDVTGEVPPIEPN